MKQVPDGEYVAAMATRMQDLEQRAETTRQYIISLEAQIAKLHRDLDIERAERAADLVLFEHARDAALIAGANAECERIEKSTTYRVGKAAMFPVRALKQISTHLAKKGA